MDDVNEVLDAAARYLEARPRSIAEVRRRLTTAGYRPELVEQAIDRLVRVGYLDDEAFAWAWLESRDRAHPRGERVLRLELRRLGVADDTVSAALEARAEDAAPGGGADEVAAERVLAKRLPSLLREPDPRRRRQKAYALLARNGFSPDVCAAIVRRVLGDGREQEPEGLG